MRSLILLVPAFTLLVLAAPVLRAEDAPKTVEDRLTALEKRVFELEHPKPPAMIPAIKDRNRHDSFLEDIKKGSNDLVFIGDSITDGWRGSGGKKIWDEAFGPLKPLNLGIGGDRTQHVLWRLQNGELDGYEAKLAVIMIGTNNGSDSKDDVAGRDHADRERSAEAPAQGQDSAAGNFSTRAKSLRWRPSQKQSGQSDCRQA